MPKEAEERGKRLLKLALDIDKAIEKAFERKDPEDADMLLNIRREVYNLYEDVKEMRETLNGLINTTLSPDLDEKKNNMH